MNNIIDIHTHVSYHEVYHNEYLTGMMDYEKANLTKERFLEFSKIILNDKTGDKHIKAMDEAGINKSVLLIIDSEMGLGKMDFSLEEIYKIHSDILNKHKDRFIVFAGINPRRGEEGYTLFKHSIEQLDFKGLKLYPSFGFPMNFGELNQYYALCEKLHLPILLHTGPSIDKLDKTIADPQNIVSVAKDYPLCNFILAHAGFKLKDPAIQRLSEIENVFFDISGFQSLPLEEQGRDLDFIFNTQFSHKVLFGTDWPLFHTFSSAKKDVDFIKDLFFNSPQSEEKDETALEKIFHDNAAKLLAL